MKKDFLIMKRMLVVCAIAFGVLSVANAFSATISSATVSLTTTRNSAGRMEN